VHGLLGTIVRFKKRFPNCCCIVVWDGEHYRQDGWRNKLYPGYKVRPKTGLGMSIIGQIRAASEILTAAGVIQVRVPELEADDVIGVLVGECTKRGWYPVIYSSDRDFCQLFANAVLITGANKTDKLGAEKKAGILARYGCTDLTQVLKVRAITGDTSDRIPPAVAGLGVKTAAKLVLMGIDPSLPNFENHSLPIQEIGARLKLGWPNVVRNYRLMRIVGSVSDPELSTKQSESLGQAVESIICNMEKGIEAHHREVIGLLGGLGLTQAFQDRTALLAGWEF
jgi:DNA polymerase-1